MASEQDVELRKAVLDAASSFVMLSNEIFPLEEYSTLTQMGTVMHAVPKVTRTQMDQFISHTLDIADWLLKENRDTI